MHIAKLRDLSILLILGMSAFACSRMPDLATEVIPERTKQAPGENPASSVAPQPTMMSPDAGDTSLSREWLCIVGELPQASQSATVEMGPGPGVPASTAQGERLMISAVVYNRDCRQLSGVEINLWQTDPEGIYGPGHGTENIQCCHYMGNVTTDENGRFDILTVKPGSYQEQPSPPPAHIHIEILHPDLRGWMTEFVFRGDPYLPSNIPEGMIAIPLEKNALPEGALLFGEAEIIVPLGSQNPTEQVNSTSPAKLTSANGRRLSSFLLK